MDVLRSVSVQFLHGFRKMPVRIFTAFSLSLSYSGVVHKEF